MEKQHSATVVEPEQDYLSFLETMDLSGLKKEVRQGIRLAVSKQRVDLVLRILTEKLIVLGIPINDCTACLFVIAGPGADFRDDNIVFPLEIPVDPENFGLEAVAKKLPQFICENYPKASGLPISIYRSLRECRK